MGSLTRMRRNGDFIDEFNNDITAKCALQPGMTLEVISIGLGEDNEEVSLFATLKVLNGDEVCVRLEDGVIFDPDYGDAEDTADGIAAAYGLDYDDVLARLKCRNIE